MPGSCGSLNYGRYLAAAERLRSGLTNQTVLFPIGARSRKRNLGVDKPGLKINNNLQNKKLYCQQSKGA
jgi:hypothetical protein